ncbi:MAG: 3-dehydroquinate synthase [Pseudomonadales bacterium]
MSTGTASDSQTISIELGERSYPVAIGAGLLDRKGVLEPFLRGNQVAVISNEVVAPLYLEALLAQLGERQVDVHLMPDGEQYKSLGEFETIMEFLLQRRHSRSTTLIALGGGVVGDITGFAAACYQRGVAFIQIPTTLLAQVDSSVGGKTAVNHALGKNMIGAFYQPQMVLADTGVLGSLPDREYAAGLAEVVKYGVIADAELFAWLEANCESLLARAPAALTHVIARSVEIKAAVVAQDEREGGIRAILNFGHTFGHALESLTGYQQYLHGEAVAIGMVMAAEQSRALGLVSPADVERLQKLLLALKLPVTRPSTLGPKEVLTAMGLDKKVQNGKLRLVLMHGLGQVALHDDVSDQALLATMAAAQSGSGS